MLGGHTFPHIHDVHRRVPKLKKKSPHLGAKESLRRTKQNQVKDIDDEEISCKRWKELASGWSIS